MIIVRNVRMDLSDGNEELVKRVSSKLRVNPKDIKTIKYAKRSLDARKKNDIHYTLSVVVSLSCNESKVIAKCHSNDVANYEQFVYEIPKIEATCRPVIAGFGPAGMFAALVLAKAGAQPIVLERGYDALTRLEKIESFRAGGKFDPDCNVQFGEGGAGTFSDGKLNTGTHDKRIEWMLEQFRDNGAPDSIVYDAKPHIGTDILVDVVQNIRKEVISLGGEVRFGNKLTGLEIENGRLKGIKAENESGEYFLECENLILAIGHSARDTFEFLNELKIPMEPKAFSMGVRIEHKQEMVDVSQYGRKRGKLPAADYSLNVHLPDGTSAYTFCMCPGGQVFAAASEEGGVVTNGMSYSARDGENSNAALLVTLHPEDYPDKSTLGGMYWQRDIEKKAFEFAGSNYFAPAQLVGDFLEGKESTGCKSVEPSYKPGVKWCSLDDVLPEKITGVLRNAIPELEKKLKGFDSEDAVMTAPETRSSSPVRIIRNEQRVSVGCEGLFPCGEGAGYAGGITSAAVDGMKCAEAVLEKLIK